jgi:hypothetical protein
LENSTGDIVANQTPEVVLDPEEDENPVDETSKVTMSSHLLSDQIEQLTNTQSSNATTITLSSPEQTVGHWEESQDIYGTTSTVAEKECQTTNGIYLSNDEYESLLKKASFCSNFQNDLLKNRSFVSNMTKPEMDPNAFEKLCIGAGGENLYHCTKDAISCSERKSHERKHLSGIRTMVIIYIMMLSQSQKCNFFQVALSRILQQFGISNEGIESLRNLSIAAHPQTIRASGKSF